MRRVFKNSAADRRCFGALSQRLLDTLDTVPIGCCRPQIDNGKNDDTPAAVLVPLIWRASDWHVILTKRAADLSHHAGQISFPGGKLDPIDGDLVATALREAEEEISLRPSVVNIMGGLSPVRSPAGFIVQPIVGVIKHDIFDRLCPAPDEVACIFTLPLSHLARSDTFKRVQRLGEGRDKSYWIVAHSDHKIWGLSARVLNDLRSRLYQPQD